VKYPVLILISVLLASACKQNDVKQKSLQSDLPIAYKFHHEVRLPIQASGKSPVLILLHGLGSNEKDLHSFAQYLDPRLLVISARAPISLGNDRYSWYQLSSGADGWTYDIEAVKQRSKDLITYIDQIIKNYQVDRDKIFIGGFSQGAILSLATGLDHSNKIAGVVCLSGRLYPELKPSLSNIKNFNARQGTALQ